MRLAVLLSLAALVACDGGSDTDPVDSDPAETDTEPAIDGSAIYAEECAICHAADGSGGTGPDIRGQSNRDAVINIVTNGSGIMPAYGEDYTAAEIAAIADYVVNDL